MPDSTPPDFNNPLIPEGINTSKSSPLFTFLKLFAAISLLLFFSAWVLGKAGRYIALQIPFEQELRLSEVYEDEVPEVSVEPLQNYLNQIKNRLEPAMNLPPGMSVKVHYVAEDTENAYAMLGGHIFLYRGLLKRLPNENSLAMLLGHEMAHVKHRDPISSLGQNLAIGSGIKLLLGYSDVRLLGNSGLYTELHFSRKMEAASDHEGILAVAKMYGHVAGAIDLYRTLHEISYDNDVESESAFFSTHPLDQQRIDTLSDLINQQGWSVAKDKIVPLPDEFQDWLSE
jgi:Zn-dependent protease with chaperone function